MMTQTKGPKVWGSLCLIKTSPAQVKGEHSRLTGAIIRDCGARPVINAY